tara:strand:+ start:158 stop:472 length:315 start_codon:yes stop_codon:yes gene_type:complete
MNLEKKGKGEEAKNALDKELTFKAQMMRNKVVGELVGKDYFNLSDNELTAFIDKAIDADFEETGDDDVVRFFENEFKKRDLEFDEVKIRDLMVKHFEESYNKLK